jgi:aconitase B
MIDYMKEIQLKKYLEIHMKDTLLLKNNMSRLHERWVATKLFIKTVLESWDLMVR